VLDEPTAALDAETEHALSSAERGRVPRARRGRTNHLLVSQRLHTVRMADQIV